MVVTLFGASGHMGFPTLKEFLAIPQLDEIRVLLLKGEKRNKLVKRLARNNPIIKIYYGDVSKLEDVKRIAVGSDYLFNLAAVIPPLSDKRPDLAYKANEVGMHNIVKVVEVNPTIKLIDITSVALYGHRNEKHPFERIGDPLIPSVYDVYAANKLRGEFELLESNIPYFVVIRQTAMIYLEMLMANMNDGLMFHTSFNDPLEWSTAEDSARLMAGIIKEDIKGNLNYTNFWRKVFNLGDGEANRISGYETIQGGFNLMGGSVEKFYNPYDNVTRNFHGGFYLDGDELDKLFHYQNDKIDDYWLKIKKKYPYMGLAKLVPHKLIRRFAIRRLYKDSNSPAYWYKHNDIARLTAFFGSKEAYESQVKDWKDFKLWDYKLDRSSSSYKTIDYGFDISKKDKDITYSDLINVAKLHGGKLISKVFNTGDVYTKLEWETCDGEHFIARPYSVLRGGHWMNPLYKSYTWDFDRLAKKDALIASYWYDSHDKNEDHCYYMDDNFNAFIK